MIFGDSFSFEMTTIGNVDGKPTAETLQMYDGSIEASLFTGVTTAIISGIIYLVHVYLQKKNENAKKDLVSVFILPPNTIELENRLRTRAQDTEEIVQQRMAKAADEMSHYREYKYVIVNDDIEASVKCIEKILAAERICIERQIGLHEFVQNLRTSS